MYHLTRKKRRVDYICKRMREGKERKRLAGDLGGRCGVYVPPVLRRVVIVIDYDVEPKIDVFRFERTNRIDSYFVSHNNHSATNMGWSIFCKKLSAHFPRLLSPLSFS